VVRVPLKKNITGRLKKKICFRVRAKPLHPKIATIVFFVVFSQGGASVKIFI